MIMSLAEQVMRTKAHKSLFVPCSPKSIMCK